MKPDKTLAHISPCRTHTGQLYNLSEDFGLQKRFKDSRKTAWVRDKSVKVQRQILWKAFVNNISMLFAKRSAFVVVHVCRISLIIFYDWAKVSKKHTILFQASVIKRNNFVLSNVWHAISAYHHWCSFWPFNSKLQSNRQIHPVLIEYLSQTSVWAAGLQLIRETQTCTAHQLQQLTSYATNFCRPGSLCLDLHVGVRVAAEHQHLLAAPETTTPLSELGPKWWHSVQVDPGGLLLPSLAGDPFPTGWSQFSPPPIPSFARPHQHQSLHIARLPMESVKSFGTKLNHFCLLIR